MSTGAKFLRATGAYLLCLCIAALAVMIDIGLPAYGDHSWVGTFLYVFVMTLLGPVLFAWAWGPGAMGLLPSMLAVLTPVLSLALLYLGFWRKQSLGCLAAAALLWGVFGGFSAWVAITGSV